MTDLYLLSTIKFLMDTRIRLKSRAAIGKAIVISENSPANRQANAKINRMKFSKWMAVSAQNYRKPENPEYQFIEMKLLFCGWSDIRSYSLPPLNSICFLYD